MKRTKGPRSPGNPLQVRLLVALLGLAPAGCSLLVQFDPDSQPCDKRAPSSASQCLAGSRCTEEGVCVRFDGGLQDGGLHDGGLQDGGLQDGGLHDGGFKDGGASDGGSEPDGGLIDAGPSDAGLTDGG